ncbi:HalOD1 output domain-containing protein [Haladaptatus pallidirubidus]|uniref:Halobacterial output domain-containing protein n=1 Tax=Haladaptatus pallidirubidus TaxID=1008152 RepID=A0AAV3UR62_9EURY|nr:HalOD1 output domain-containing protein [Haladaptatus pallidirubidus]
METNAVDNNHKLSSEDSPRSLTNHVLTAIIEAEDLSLDSLDPLYDVIDPDALDTLFAPRADGSPRPFGRISFHYAGYQVTVSSEGSVALEPEKR